MIFQGTDNFLKNLSQKIHQTAPEMKPFYHWHATITPNFDNILLLNEASNYLVIIDNVDLSSFTRAKLPPIIKAAIKRELSLPFGEPADVSPATNHNIDRYLASGCTYTKENNYPQAVFDEVQRRLDRMYGLHYSMSANIGEVTFNFNQNSQKFADGVYIPYKKMIKYFH